MKQNVYKITMAGLTSMQINKLIIVRFKKQKNKIIIQKLVVHRNKQRKKG